ncbi:MAG: S-layer homology domain-containing protein [Clostridia bacterium]|nr:S-layer homology domain-containing protein [Clostridia bacterium]
MRNLKKVIALVAVFAMMVSTVAFAQFSDVAEDHNYYEAIEMLSNLKILTGDDQDGDGTMDFRPEDKITRAEVAVIISRIQGINNAAQVATEFVDVPSSHWASGYVAQAAGQKIVNGYGDGNFGPEDNVLYEQAVKMLMETLGYAPFVEANGGYPTGHLTAAQRYGVVEGVVGGTPGVEATRGQIAQMVYNAIDTPIMDRYTYGKDAEYMIFDGKSDRDFMTLLTRDLGVKKFTAILNETAITKLDTFKTIDTSDAAVVDFDFTDYDDTDEYNNYEIAEVASGTVFEGESEASALLGQEVEVYVQEASRRGEFDIISIAATAKNSALAIGLDAFKAYVDGGSTVADTIQYYKNATDRTATDVKLTAAPKVILNGVATDFDVFSELADKTWSGEIVLLDNGSTTNYDIIFVNVNTPVVVDEVSANGKVTIKNDDAETIDGKRIQLYFDEEDTTQIINLTKDGVAIDFTELAEWDVLSVLANDKNAYIDAEVISSGKIEGSVSAKTPTTTGPAYTIAGDNYQVAKYAYECGSLQPGSAGIFYIDNYGKIVAYDKTGNATASDAYAYILNATRTQDDWGNENVRVQLLDKSGAVYDAYFASKVKLEYAPYVLKAAGSGTLNASYDLEDIDAETFADELKNAFVTYEANSSGEIKTVTFEQTDEDVSSLYFTKAGEGAEYDLDNATIKVGGKKFDVDEDTVVFYITNNETLPANKVYNVDTDTISGTASKTSSRVDTVASLADDTFDYARIYDAQDGVASAIVIFNTKGGISGSSSLAVIDSVGKAVVGEDTVDAVTFFKDGEKFTAYTDVDYSGPTLYGVAAGSLFKLALSADGTTITDAVAYGTVALADDDDDNALTDPQPAALALEISGAVNLNNANTALKEATYFGPVVDYVSGSKTIRIALPAISGYDFTDYTSIKAANANVYVYDPLKTTNKISVGVPADVNYDKQLVEQANANDDALVADKAVKVKNGASETTIVDATKDALGLMDFVVAYEYDGDIIDVVIYRPYDFGKYFVE